MGDSVVVPPILDETTIANFLIGVFLPLVLSWVRSNRATAKWASWYAFGACLGISLLITFFGKTFFGTWSSDAMVNVRLVAMNIVSLLIAAWNFYARLWKPTGVADKLEQSGPQLGDPVTVTAEHDTVGTSHDPVADRGGESG